jgi:hypothetical protein
MRRGEQDKEFRERSAGAIQAAAAPYLALTVLQLAYRVFYLAAAALQQAAQHYE